MKRVDGLVTRPAWSAQQDHKVSLAFAVSRVFRASRELRVIVERKENQVHKVIAGLKANEVQPEPRALKEFEGQLAIVGLKANKDPKAIAVQKASEVCVVSRGFEENRVYVVQRDLKASEDYQALRVNEGLLGFVVQMANAV